MNNRIRARIKSHIQRKGSPPWITVKDLIKDGKILCKCGKKYYLSAYLKTKKLSNMYRITGIPCSCGRNINIQFKGGNKIAVDDLGLYLEEGPPRCP